MAGVRDPAFWKRFSYAVHLDDTQRAEKATRPELERSDSWLERQRQKRSRRTFICWIFWLVTFALAAGIVIIVLWLNATGRLDKYKPYTDNTGEETQGQ